MNETPAPALLSDERLSELKRLAEQATPGPWQAKGEPGIQSYFGRSVETVARQHHSQGCQLDFGYPICDGTDKDVDYIAAASPDTMLAMLDHIAAREHQYAETLKSLLQKAEELDKHYEGLGPDDIQDAATSLGIDLIS